MLERITPVLLTGDEEANIARTLGQLRWASEVVVVDSGSRDRTVEIARSFPNVRVVEQRFESFEKQWTRGVTDPEIATEWVLALDADFFVPDALVEEMRQLRPADDVAGYIASFTYAIGGKPLRGSLYPPKLVLMRRSQAYFSTDGHTQVAHVDGPEAMLRTPVIHDDRKSLDRFLQRQRKYTREEADKLLAADRRTLGRADRLRLRGLGPFVVVPYTLFAKGCLLDGRAGLYYTFERLIAETLLAMEILARRLGA